MRKRSVLQPLSQEPPDRFRLFNLGPNPATDGIQAIVDRKDLERIMATYKRLGRPLAGKIEHNRGEKACEFGLEVVEDGLDAYPVKWTPLGLEKWQGWTSSFVSPEFDTDAREHVTCVWGAGLTDDPASFNPVSVHQRSIPEQMAHHNRSVGDVMAMIRKAALAMKPAGYPFVNVEALLDDGSAVIYYGADCDKPSMFLQHPVELVDGGLLLGEGVPVQSKTTWEPVIEPTVTHTTIGPIAMVSRAIEGIPLLSQVLMSVAPEGAYTCEASTDGRVVYSITNEEDWSQPRMVVFNYRIGADGVAVLSDPLETTQEQVILEPDPAAVVPVEVEVSPAEVPEPVELERVQSAQEIRMIDETAIMAKYPGASVAGVKIMTADGAESWVDLAGNPIPPPAPIVEVEADRACKTMRADEMVPAPEVVPAPAVSPEQVEAMVEQSVKRSLAGLFVQPETKHKPGSVPAGNGPIHISYR